MTSALLQALQRVDPEILAGNAENTFSELVHDSGRTALMMAVLSLPPSMQTEIYEAIGSRENGFELGGLLQRVTLTDAQSVVIADASTITRAQPFMAVPTSVSISGANDATKLYRLYQQPNAYTLLAPTFFKALQDPTTSATR